jgi:type VI secretion system protein VasG
MDVDIKGLLRKLNRTGTRALEGAAGLCVSRTHYEVTVEHVLLQLVEDSAADVPAVLRHFGVEPSNLLRIIQHHLDRLRSGNAGRPVFSPLLLQWVQDAWLIASVDYQDGHVRSGTLLLALAARPDRYTAEDLSPLLDAIRLDELKRDLYKICASTREAQAAAGEATAGAPAAGAAPGRPDGDSAIARFMVDFTEKARRGEIDPVFGRDREIRQMIDILARRRKNNPIVVGEPGVGKTAVVEGLALRIVEGDVPDVLKSVRLLSLDLGLLQAGAGVKGEFENRLKSVISEVKASSTPIVTFIDEAHTLIGAGGSAGTSDAANLLKPALARGELRTIAATTWSEYKKYFEKDAALERRFQLVKLDEPSEDDTVVMIRGLKEKYESAHRIRILDEAVTAAARLSSRYISGRQLPDKAVDLLDTAAARVKIARATKPEQVDDLERRLQALEREKRVLEEESAAGGAADSERMQALGAEIAGLHESRGRFMAKFEKERAALERVLELRARLDGSGNGPPAAGAAGDGAAAGSAAGSGSAPAAQEPAGQVATATALSSADRDAVKADLEGALKSFLAAQGEDPLVPLDVDARVVAQVVSNWTGIPVAKMAKDEASSMLIFKQRLAERIKGQDQALDAVDRGLRAARSGLKSPQQPIGQFLFVGPSGVGKTECATVVADLMFGGERFLTTINMSEFQEKHTVSRLIGSPPGYVGYGEGGMLTEAIRQRPYSVVLLDEVEKADPEVLNLFYQVFDKGTLSDGEGRLIDCKNCVFFLTTNLCTDIITNLCQGPVRPTTEELVGAIRPTLSKYFKPALLARMEVVPFFTLPPEHLKDIVRIKLRKIAERLADSHKMTLDIAPVVVEVIANRCTEVETGARNIDHIIRGSLLPMMSTSLLERMAEGPLPGQLRIQVTEGDQFALEFGDAPARRA